MKHLKMFGFAALAAALMAFFAATPASATILESGSGTQYKSGTSLTAESEGTIELHPPFGSINCKKSHFGGKTTNDGGAGTNVNGNFESFSFSECNAHITIIVLGIFSTTHIVGSNFVLSITSFEIVVVYLGFHCIYKTNNTKLGTVTGSTSTGGNATLDVEATLPRTGGNSGAFCGSTAQLTGSYKFTNPSTLNGTS